MAEHGGISMFQYKLMNNPALAFGVSQQATNLATDVLTSPFPDSFEVMVGERRGKMESGNDRRS